jgi:hypothetical protein
LSCTMVWYSTKHSKFLAGWKNTRQKNSCDKVFINLINSVWIQLYPTNNVFRNTKTICCFWRFYLLKSGRWSSGVTHYYAVMKCVVMLEDTTFNICCTGTLFYLLNIVCHFPSAQLCYRHRHTHQEPPMLFIRECMHHLIVICSFHVIRMQNTVSRQGSSKFKQHFTNVQKVFQQIVPLQAARKHASI